MLESNIISKLDSKNVSKDTGITQTRFNEMWDNANNNKKNEAVKLGGYRDTRSFTNIKNSGNISVRMVVALSITFNMDPFFITAESATKKALTKENLNKFLIKHDFKKFVGDKEEIRKKELEIHFENMMRETDSSIISYIEKLTNEDTITMLSSELIKSVSNSITKDKIDIIKILLMS